MGLATEYSVNQLRREIMGNRGQGWVKASRVSIKTWYREEEQEIRHHVNGEPVRRDIIIGSIVKENILSTIQHFIDIISEQGQFVELQTFENCPEILVNCVVLVLGNDSGAGYTREGVRIVNRIHGNARSKVYLTNLMMGSDKGLSCFQKQALFSSLSALRGVSTIKVAGQERKLIKISCMDYEAQAQ